jgi:hypothetical protein
MQDTNDFDRLAMTVDEARSLARVADIIRQRDELCQEVTLLRQIMAEVSALRELLDRDADGVIVATASSNGLSPPLFVVLPRPHRRPRPMTPKPMTPKPMTS